MKIYNKAYKYRLLPNKEQEIAFSKTFGCTRFMWNKLLEYANKFYQQNNELGFTTPARFKEEFAWLKEIDSLALSNVQMFLKKAFSAFFGKKAEHPKMKSKRATKHSYTTNNQQASNAIRIEDNSIRLPKIGFVKFIQHRPLQENEKIKTCTITKTASGKYYISITVEGISNVQPIPINKDKVIGLDFSLSQLFVGSDGTIAKYPRYYRQAEEKIKRLYKALSRKKKGSKNRQKARLKLARYLEYIVNMRKDFLHKLSTSLVKIWDAIIIEDFNMHGMAQALNFGKSVSDCGWATFVGYLKYKFAHLGKQLIKISKWYSSSKMCSCCGALKENLELKDRIYNCEHCLYQEDRDLNAAINIRTAGMAGIA